MLGIIQFAQRVSRHNITNIINHTIGERDQDTNARGGYIDSPARSAKQRPRTHPMDGRSLTHIVQAIRVMHIIYIQLGLSTGRYNNVPPVPLLLLNPLFLLFAIPDNRPGHPNGVWHRPGDELNGQIVYARNPEDVTQVIQW